MKESNSKTKQAKPLVFSPPQISMIDQSKPQMSSAFDNRRQTTSTVEGGRHSFPLGFGSKVMNLPLMSISVHEKKPFEEIAANINLKSSFAEKRTIEKRNIENLRQNDEPFKPVVRSNEESSPSDANKFSDGLTCVQ